MLSRKSAIPNVNIQATMRPKGLNNYAFLQVQLYSVPASTDAKAEKQIQSSSSKETAEVSPSQQAKQHWEMQASLENSVLDGILAWQEQGTAQCRVCSHKRLQFARTMTLEVCLPSKPSLVQSCSLKVCISASRLLYCLVCFKKMCLKICPEIHHNGTSLSVLPTSQYCCWVLRLSTASLYMSSSFHVQ